MNENIIPVELTECDSVRKGDRVLPSPATMFKWFLEPLSQIPELGECLIDYTLASPVELTSNGGDGNLTAYTKGMIKLISHNPIDNNNESSYMFGLIWSFTASVEIIKVFRGANVFACANGVISNADDVETFKLKRPKKGLSPRQSEVSWRRSLEDVELLLDNVVIQYSNDFVEHRKKTSDYIHGLMSTTFEIEEVNLLIGKLVVINYRRNWITSYMMTFALDSLLDLNVPKSQGRYHIFDKGNQTMWNIYNAFTYYLSTGKTEVDTIIDKNVNVHKLLSVVFGVEDEKNFK